MVFIIAYVLTFFCDKIYGLRNGLYLIMRQAESMVYGFY